MVETTDDQWRAEQHLELAEQLVEQAKDRRLDLVDPDGLIAASRTSTSGSAKHRG